MNRVAMTRASGFGSVPTLLAEGAGAHVVAWVFDAAAIPIEVTANPSMKLPVAAMLDLFERASRALDDPCLGLRVGHGMSLASFGQGMVSSNEAPTLAAAFDRAARAIRFHQPPARLAAELDGDYVTSRYYRPVIGLARSPACPTVYCPR